MMILIMMMMMIEISREKNYWFTIVETRWIWIIYPLIVHSSYSSFHWKYLSCCQQTTDRPSRNIRNTQFSEKWTYFLRLTSFGSGIQVCSKWNENLFLHHQNTEKATVILNLWVFRNLKRKGYRRGAPLAPSPAQFQLGLTLSVRGEFFFHFLFYPLF